MQKATIKSKDKKLTRKDIKSKLKDKGIDNFDRMLNISNYAFRIKRALYTKGKLSPKGFLYNDDIYSLELGKKTSKGEILIADFILDIFERFLAVEKFVNKGDALTAFLLDNDDIFYNYFKESLKDDTISEEKYVVQFNESYNRVTSLLLNYEVSEYIASDPKLEKEINAFTSKKKNKSE